MAPCNTLSRRLRALWVCLFAWGSCGAPAWAQTTIVNVNADTNGVSTAWLPGYLQNPVKVAFPAGAYRVGITNPTLDPSALYYAWNYDARFTASANWVANYYIIDDTTVTSSGYADQAILFAPSKTSQTSAIASFNENKDQHFVFNLPTARTLDFVVNDYVPSVNLGGVSIKVQNVGPQAASGSASLVSGTNVATSLLKNAGAAAVAGTVDFYVPSVASAGDLSATWYKSLPDSLLGSGDYPPNPILPDPTAGGLQMWDFAYTGSITGRVGVIVHYDDSLFAPGTDESKLSILHYTNNQWEPTPATTLAASGVVPPSDIAWPPTPVFNGNVQIDTLNNRIYFETNSFSPFALVMTPEPSSAALLLSAGSWILVRSRRERCYRS